MAENGVLRHQRWDGCHVELDDRGDRLTLHVWTADGLLSTWVQGDDLEMARRHGFGADAGTVARWQRSRSYCRGGCGQRILECVCSDYSSCPRCGELLIECRCAEREARCPAGLDENDPDDREFIRCVEAVRDEAAAAVTADLDAEARTERC